MTKKRRLNPILRILLIGVYDEGSDLYALRGIPLLIRHIWSIVVDYWKGCIKVGKPIRYKGVRKFQDTVTDNLGYFVPNLGVDGGFYSDYVNKNTVEFPKHSEININMMPFMCSYHFEDSYLPEEFKDYWLNMIEPCLRTQSELNGKICYLTIQESFVEADTSQRRPGIHTETPGILRLYDEESQIETETMLKQGEGHSKCIAEHIYINWGAGYSSHDTPHGGIYMASSVGSSSKMWNCRIISDHLGNEIIGEHGDISHLRQFLPKGEVLKKNTMYWFTDRTPHESLPLKSGTYRQFFRLVTDNVTVWFKDHSTANPKGLVPDPAITKIVSGSKFDKSKKLHIVNAD